MANTRVSDLSAGGAFAGTDLLYVVETAGVGGVKKTLTQMAEFIRDTIGAALVSGTNILVTVNDGGDTITIDNTATAYTDEMAQDAIGAMVDSTLVYVDGTPLLTRAALTGDVTAAQGSNATTIANDAVTFAKMQNIATNSLVGRDTAGTGDPENILLNATLSMDGSGNLQREALTGDVTAAQGSNATTIANDAVTNVKLANMAEATIKGRAAAAGTGDPTDLTAAQVATILGLSGLEVLTANRDYYVRTDGSNSNNGLADSAGGAFLTIQKAISVIYTLVIPAGITVTINVGGTQSGARNFSEDVTLQGPWLGGGTVLMTGDTTTPTNRTITSVTSFCLNLKFGARLSIQGLGFISGGAGDSAILADSASVLNILGSVNFAAFSGGRHLWAANGAVIDVRVNYTIAGGGAFHAQAQTGTINMLTGTRTFSGTPAFTSATVSATAGGILQVTGTNSGGATGTRYAADTNGIINTFGGGASYFPGDVAGTTATQGQYL